jgi:hypothetical protein
MRSRIIVGSLVMFAGLAALDEEAHAIPKTAR